MENRIKWSRGQWSTSGRVNGLIVFSIGWSVGSARKKPYVLNAALPGVPRTRHTDEDEAKQQAETVLKFIVEKLGATFPETEA